MSDRPTNRMAHASDSRFIAEMIEISSDGIASIEWTGSVQVAGVGTALDIGAELYSSEEGDYSYRNCCLGACPRIENLLRKSPFGQISRLNSLNMPNIRLI